MLAPPFLDQLSLNKSFMAQKFNDGFDMSIDENDL